MYKNGVCLIPFYDEVTKEFYVLDNEDGVLFISDSYDDCCDFIEELTLEESIW